MKIKTPIVLFSRNSFLVIPEDGLRVLGIRMPTEGTLLRDASAKKGYKEPPGWMMEADGKFRQFSFVGYRNKGAAFLSNFLGLTKVELRTTPPKMLTVREFQELLRAAVAKVKDQQAVNLLHHLERFEDEQIVDSEILSKWPI